MKNVFPTTWLFWELNWLEVTYRLDYRLVVDLHLGLEVKVEEVEEEEGRDFGWIIEHLRCLL